MGELAVSRAFGDKEFKIGLQNLMNEEKNDHQQAVAADGGSGPRAGSVGSKEDGGAGSLPEKPLVTAEPEILISELTPEDEFVLLACDGLFDVLGNEEVIDLIKTEMKQHGDAQRAVEMLSHVAIHKRRTRDNVTIVLVILNRWW
uniref:PPM-type phosphatase domain-containing protein n=1 Tax=Fibrocapsa japonica TaxID=94617 RepID=A0A7S2V0C4_9STRA|mmetsp:Transcript_21990/g.31908  ORF Transcript_21990/g.31908 Transcript_21990/m.31908 type:complete len:145 (+) Transcript_21990:3-437(+)